METTIFILVVSGYIMLNTILIYSNYRTIKSQQKQLNENLDLINSLDQKIHMTEQSCVGYTTQTVKNTNGELEALYKHVDTKMIELSTQIYKDFDIKKTQTNVY